MNRRLHVCAVLVLGLLCTNGCAAVLLGAGFAGGYAISKDSVRNTFDRSKEEAYRQSLAVAEDVGFVMTDDPAHGLIKVRVQNTNVTITIKQLTRKAVELKVSARNQVLLPEIDIAHDVYNKIMARLE